MKNSLIVIGTQIMSDCPDACLPVYPACQEDRLPIALQAGLDYSCCYDCRLGF